MTAETPKQHPDVMRCTDCGTTLNVCDTDGNEVTVTCNCGHEVTITLLCDVPEEWSP